MSDSEDEIYQNQLTDPKIAKQMWKEEYESAPHKALAEALENATADIQWTKALEQQKEALENAKAYYKELDTNPDLYGGAQPAMSDEEDHVELELQDAKANVELIENNVKRIKQKRDIARAKKSALVLIQEMNWVKEDDHEDDPVFYFGYAAAVGGPLDMTWVPQARYGIFWTKRATLPFAETYADTLRIKLVKSSHKYNFQFDDAEPADLDLFPFEIKFYAVSGDVEERLLPEWVFAIDASSRREKTVCGKRYLY